MYYNFFNNCLKFIYYFFNFADAITFILVSELLIPYLPQMPKSLELFARYLLPDYTSFGLEVLKFQHQFLYENLIIDDCTQDTTI